ncbi:MAG: NAD(P)-dependent oxidoreductase [Alphaproteobacteria bacterium]|nr:NAD(P)-dependent oxidoreductase [Alphaproteobacteria bacterium]
MMNIGFAGLGKMGAVMAPRFLDAEHKLTVWNRTSAKADALKARGAVVAATPADLVRASDIVVSMLSDDASVIALFDGFLAADVKGKLFIEMSTLKPETVKALAVRIEAKGGRFVDSPVGGTVGPARDGKLFAFVGGAAEDVARAKPVFDVLTRRVMHAGAVGQGALLKLVVNLPLGVYWQALAEAMAMGEAGGLDAKLMLDTLQDSSAALAVLGLKRPAILGENVPVAFDVASMQKDFAAILETGSGLGVPMPASAAAFATYAAAVAGGQGAADSVAIVKFLTDRMTRKS